MGILSSKRWIADLDRAIEAVPAFSQLQGKQILITGATGLAGSAITELLIRYNETRQGRIGILAAGRSSERMRARFAEFFDRDYFTFLPYDATEGAFQPDVHADFIIHGGANSSPNRIVEEPVETMTANILGLLGLLQYAKRTGAERLLFISSSEVYGKKETDAPFRETDSGAVDLLNLRSSYTIGKQAAETLCASFADEYGVNVVIVRPGHIYGPTATRDDMHVSSAWAYAAANGENLVMKSDGMQLRSYVHCLDLATAILTVLLRGESGNAYNISNPASVVSIRDMAALLAKAGNTKLIREEADATEKKAFNPMKNSSLDSAKLEALGWHGIFDAESGFSETVEVIREKTDRFQKG